MLPQAPPTGKPKFHHIVEQRSPDVLLDGLEDGGDDVSSEFASAQSRSDLARTRWRRSAGNVSLMLRAVESFELLHTRAPHGFEQLCETSVLKVRR